MASQNNDAASRLDVKYPNLLIPGPRGDEVTQLNKLLLRLLLLLRGVNLDRCVRRVLLLLLLLFLLFVDDFAAKHFLFHFQLSF